MMRAILLLSALAVTGTAAAATPARVVSGDGAARCSSNALCYTGHWQFVSGRNDGRFEGRSARSYVSGDNVSFAFTGTRLRIFGVTGPAGGMGVLMLGREQRAMIDFYSPQNRAHVVVYTSPPLSNGRHVVTLVVAGRHDARSRGDYINVDQIEVLRAP